MNRQEYKNLLLDRHENDTLRIYDDFCQLQDEALKTLAKFASICEKYEIKYSLAWGSMLGAVRDNGQIPWDYDIDVFVPMYERVKLVAAMKKEIEDDYYAYGIEFQDDCPAVLIRMAPKGFDISHLHVDVFFLIGASSDLQEAHLLANKIKKAKNYRYWKLMKYDEVRNSSFKAKIKYLLRKTIVLFKNKKSLNDKYVSLCNMYSLKDSTYCLSPDQYADEAILNTKYFNDLIEKKTDNGVYRIPREYDKVLETLYGDYRTYPSFESTVKEINRTYCENVRICD